MTTIITHEPATQSQPGSSIVDHFRRYQTLHVIHFERTAPKASRWNIVQAFKASKIYVGVTFVGFLGLAAVLCLLGLYGTSAVLLVSAISQLSLAYVNIRRPPGYLESNETSEGYMLTATHSNAMTWYLYMGDRGVIDTLLNKTMLFVRNDKQEQLCATWLRLAHGVQLLSMTFVAAQKGWDGVGLLVLVGIEWMIRWNTREQKLAGRWLRREGISAKVRSYEFTGRTVLLGAVQALSNSRITTWMDGIIVPHPRRDAWLGCLAKLSSGSHHGVESSWNEKDARFIIRSAALSAEAAAMIRQELEAEDEYDRNV
ncbi:MAG: hypothetical protein M1821_001229 [Bathelium mastoideum]|nr:MAG: hypothetical protein M1821_001229 [Bathelium mastoideum]